MTGDELVADASTILIDQNHVGWSAASLLGYVDDFQSNTAMLKPDAYPVRKYVPLISGFKQELPDGTNPDLPRGIAVLDIDDNENSGRVCVLVEKELLDAENRFWPQATRMPDADCWAADPRDPRRFDVSPPNDGSGSLAVLYGAVPPRLADGTETLALGDQYKLAGVTFLLFRAYAKNSKRQDLGKSQGYWSQYLNILGIKSTAQVAVAPKVSQQVGS